MATAIQEPSAYVTSTELASRVTLQSEMPTTSELTAMLFSPEESRSALRSLVSVGGRAHVLQSRLNAGERLRMTDQQIASALQTRAQPPDDILPGRLVEVHHDVAAKDRVKRRALPKRLDQV